MDQRQNELVQKMKSNNKSGPKEGELTKLKNQALQEEVVDFTSKVGIFFATEC